MEPRTEFILVSAYADFEYAKEAIALGSAYYLLKPVDEFELERAIKKIADKIGAQQATQRLLESTHRQKELLTLYSYMRTGAGKAAAQKSAGRLSVCFCLLYTSCWICFLPRCTARSLITPRKLTSGLRLPFWTKITKSLL